MLMVTTAYHLSVGDDLSAEVISKRELLPELVERRGERVTARAVLRAQFVPASVVLSEDGAPGLVVQPAEGGNCHAVVVSVETLLRAAEAVRRLMDNLGDQRQCCPDHGLFTPSAPLGRASDCPRCLEERLAADAVERLK